MKILKRYYKHPDEYVDMRVYRGFGMARNRNGWDITHPPTGEAVAYRAKNYLQAMTVVDALHIAHDDWNNLDIPIAKIKRIGGMIHGLTQEKPTLYR